MDDQRPQPQADVGLQIRLFLVAAALAVFALPVALFAGVWSPAAAVAVGFSLAGLLVAVAGLFAGRR